RTSHPGPADLHVPVVTVDVPEARRSRDPADRLVHGGEGQRAAFRLLAQRGLDVAAQLLARLHPIRGPAPQVGIEPDLAQPLEMPLERERLHAHARAVERGRRAPGGVGRHPRSSDGGCHAESLRNWTISLLAGYRQPLAMWPSDVNAR